jgi:hypothetical protein
MDRRVTVFACVSFETVMVVKPAVYYGAEEVRLFHYSREGKDQIYGRFYDQVEKDLRAKLPGVRIIEYASDPIYDFPKMLRALLAGIREARESGAGEILVNASSGPAQFTAAAVVACFMTGARAFTVGTRKYTVSEKDIEKLYFRDGEPVGLSEDTYDPRLITDFPIEPPDENMVRSLRVYAELRGANSQASAPTVIAALKEKGLWTYTAKEGAERTPQGQKETMYYQRHYVDEWRSRGWIAKDDPRSKYDLTEDGKNIIGTFYADPRGMTQAY